MTPPPRLVPELYCRNFRRSLQVYTQIFGFSLLHERAGFALLDLGGERVMLEALGPDAWRIVPAVQSGCGVHLDMMVEALAPLLERAKRAGLAAFRQPEEAWYRLGGAFTGQRHAVFSDPDGHRLRFSEPLGRRSVAPGGRVLA
ncbi:MAG: VOC family protein [Pseudomonadota bacterium]